MMTPTPEQASRYRRIAEAIRLIIASNGHRPNLTELADKLGISPGHLQKEFSLWAGISPQQFFDQLTTNAMQQRLRSQTVMQSAINGGLSSSGRLHDLMIRTTGMTPGEYRHFGQTLTIDYDIHDSPFGLCLLAVTPRGICHLSFLDSDTEAASQIHLLKQHWPYAHFRQHGASGAALMPRIFPKANAPLDQPLHLLLKGTDFQMTVWNALLRVPFGEVSAYQYIAKQIGKPKAHRAVASAIAQNHIGFLIPCHRVIRASGEIHGYRWGSTRKQALLGWEASHPSRSNK